MAHVSSVHSPVADLPPPAEAIARSATGAIRVEIVGAGTFVGLTREWRDLAANAAEPNVFLEPAMLLAAEAADPCSPIKVLLAWRTGPDGRELAGVWALRAKGGIVQRLQAPAAPLAALASPVIRPDCMDDVLESWFQALADSRLPKLLELKAMPDEGPLKDALDRVLRHRRSECRSTEHRERAMLHSTLSGEAYLDHAISGSRRRKLRQLRSRLGRTGTVAYRRCTDPAAVAGATETFLALEAAGWKGRRGTAVGCDDGLAAFTRRVMADLAADGLACVTALTLDERPISMGLVLQSGRAAYTWKIAYDETAAPFSPGYLLALEDTTAFLADATLDEVDSCASAEFGIMAEVWRERKRIADLYIGVRRGPSRRFRAAMAIIDSLELLPRLRRRMRGREQLRRLYYRARKLLPGA
jgi:CelD/BcsL family acetyltransferase involved in cellulose biosynthesis